MTDMQRRRGKAHDRSSVAWTRRAGRVHGRALAGSGGHRLPRARMRWRSPRSVPSDAARRCARSRSCQIGPSAIAAPSSRADYVVYLDDTLLGEGWDRELKANGGGSGEQHAHVRRPTASSRWMPTASRRLSWDGRFRNTAFLGALSVLCDRIGLDDVKQAIRQYMPKKLHEKNIAIVEAAREALAGAAAASPRTPQGLAAGASDLVVFDSGLRCCSRCARSKEHWARFSEGRRPHSRAARRRARFPPNSRTPPVSRPAILWPRTPDGATRVRHRRGRVHGVLAVLPLLP